MQALSPPKWYKGSDEDSDETHVLPKVAEPGPKFPRGTVPHPAKLSVVSGRKSAVRKGLESSSPAGKSVKTPPKARLRHDDSQVEFAAIGSSPLGSGLEDSQHLTDRQKEVRQRQGLEAAMFPEIKSSPKSPPRNAEYTLPKLLFRSEKEHHPRSEPEEETSPVYPPDILMNDFLGSSPTPASGKKGQAFIRSDDDPPSSPPINTTHSRQITETVSSGEANETGLRPMEKQDAPLDHSSDGNRAETAVAVRKQSNTHDHQLGQGPSDKAKISVPNDHVMSDVDVFVDAPSEQSMGAAEMHNTTANKDQAHPGAGYEPSTYDEQATAQLVGEMTRASSQQSNTGEVAEATSSKKRKRKGKSDEARTSSKRAKARTTLPESRDASEVVKAGETVAECVLIDVRPFNRDQTAGPTRIKRERSSSPLRIAETQPHSGAGASVSQEDDKLPTRRSRNRRVSQHQSTGQSNPSQAADTSQTDNNDVAKPSPSMTVSRRSTRRSEAATSSPPNSSPIPAGPSSQKPGSITKTGRIRASMRWFWSVEEPTSSQESSTESTPCEKPRDDKKNGTTLETDQAHGRQRSEEPSTQHAEQDPAQPEEHVQVPANMDSAITSIEGREGRGGIPSSSLETRDDQPTAAGILSGFKAMLNNIKQVALGSEEERAIVAVLFESVREVGEAGRRHEAV